MAVVGWGDGRSRWQQRKERALNNLLKHADKPSGSRDLNRAGKRFDREMHRNRIKNEAGCAVTALAAGTAAFATALHARGWL